MRDLAIRDWKLHKDALLILGAVILLMAPLALLPGLSPEDQRVLVPMTGRAAFGLGCLMPALLHFRELAYGTLTDQWSLPVSRRAFVGLRWAQALGCAALFFLIVSLPWLPSLGLRGLARLHANSILGWIFFWAFALQLPFQLRFGQKGGFAMGASILVLEGWGFSNLPPAEVAKAPALLRTLVHAAQLPHRVWQSLGTASPWVEALALLLALAACFHLAVLASERRDV